MKKTVRLKKIAIVLFYSFLILNPLHFGAETGLTAPFARINFREEMKKFVISISAYGRKFNPKFIIIPQNGHELITDNGTISGILQKDYLNAISAAGRESLFYGYPSDNKPTPLNETNRMLNLCRLFRKAGKPVLVTDYCRDKSKVNSSYKKNTAENFISFAADKRNLTTIPKYPVLPNNSNSENINSISDVKNFLFLLNPQNYSSKEKFIEVLSQTDYDLLIIDLFYFDEQLTKNDIERLKNKHSGGKRLTVCYMSIGEVENYRYYWKENPMKDKWTWLAAENPLWKGNYVVRYWEKDWQKIIMGGENSYLHKIITAGFDGVYLDIIDAFEYFEQLKQDL